MDASEIASKLLRVALMLCAAALMVNCASAPIQPNNLPNNAEQKSDAPWLNRVTYGITTQTVAEYRLLKGRQGFLAAQLTASSTTLPAEIAAQIAGLEVTHLDAAQTLANLTAERRRINAMSDGDDKELARKALNEQGNKFAYQARRRELLRALYSRAQLQEQMVAFWLNHFSVYENKADLRWLVGDYAERAIRPHALGRFRDLVMATLTHPAMLQYLDNVQNAVGRINENYARELMELHTLGVNGGYTQQDVQNLARILTGVGVNNGADRPKLRREWQNLYRTTGGFEFNPARHDFSDKVLLGAKLKGSGFAEVEQAVDLLVHTPACAKFISRQLATTFVTDAPSATLVDRLAKRFRETDGDISAVLRSLFTADEFTASLGKKFRDPRQYVISALRLAYDGRTIENARPALAWLSSMGEAQFGRQTPDGYPASESGWASSGQMSRRFEIARAIGNGSAGLFDPETGGSSTAVGFPQLTRRLYYDALEPTLSANTRQALDKAASQQEWNTFLLSSPEFNFH